MTTVRPDSLQHMAYDEELADRVRALLDDWDPIEKKMFGVLAFMVGGKMAIAAAGAGGVMVRVGSDRAEELCRAEGVEHMVMGDRPMNGWLLVDGARLESDAELKAWIERGVEAAARAAG